MLTRDKIVCSKEYDTVNCQMNIAEISATLSAICISLAEYAITITLVNVTFPLAVFDSSMVYVDTN